MTAARPPSIQSTALRRTMAARWAHLGAMHVAVEPRQMRAVGEFLCIRDLAPAHGRELVCCINGEWISRTDWWQPVRVGDVVVFADVAGDGGGGSDAGRVLGMIAIAVLSAYTAGAVGAAYGTAWGAAAGAAVGIAGGMLVNALFPVQMPSSAVTASSTSTSPTYTAQLQGNAPRLGQAIPVRYGQELIVPDWACPAYSEFDGTSNDQYYCTGLSIGLGRYNVLAVYIDDTPLQYFSDAECVIVGPGHGTATEPTGYGAVAGWSAQSLIEMGMISASEVGGQDLVDNSWTGPYNVVKAGFAINRLYCDIVFPRGVGSVSDDGTVQDLTITWQVQAQKINDAGTAIGDWILVGQESLTESTTQSVRRTYSYDVAPGRWRVRVRRISMRSDNSRQLTDMQWAGLRGRLNIAGIVRDDLTGIAIRIRASRQLSALTQRQVRVLVQRLVSTWNGASWSAPVFNRNPAWALADIWRDTVYGRGLSDDRIDLESLHACAHTWDARQDRFDYSFDSTKTTDEAAQTVATAGRARTMLRRGAVYSLVRDEPQSVAVGVFMPRNIDADSFALSWQLPTSESADAYAVTYRDGQVWDDRIVYAQIYNGQIYGYVANAAGVPLRPAGVPAPAVIQDVTLAGVVGQHQAMRHALYLAARSLYRLEEGSLSADLDGLMVSLGSLIGIGHDAAQWAQSGDVVDWSPTSLIMTLSEPPSWVAGQTHYIRLQADTGELGGAIEVTPGSTEFKVVLASAPATAPSVDAPDRERTRYLFGTLADVQRTVVVAGVRPTSVDEVSISFFVDDARVHAADAAWLPSGSEVQDALGDGRVDVIDTGGGGSSSTPEFLEDFSGGIGMYTLSGLPTTFSVVSAPAPWTQALHIATVAYSAEQTFKRLVSTAGIKLRELVCRFQLPELHDNTSGLITLYCNNVRFFDFIPQLDKGHDSGMRPYVQMGSPFAGKAPWGRMQLGSDRLVQGVWYEFRLLVTPANGGTSASIKRLDDSTVVGVATFGSSSTPSDMSGIPVTHLEFRADNKGTTTSADFARIELNP